MANRIKYGFRGARPLAGKSCLQTERWPIASGYQGAIQGGTNVDVNVGDVVKRLASGYLSIAEGSEITSYNPGTVDADIPVGVVMGFEPYFDGTDMEPTDFLPGGTTYGTNFARQSFALVVPLQNAVWSVAVDATSASFDTYVEWLATTGATIDMVNSNGITDKAEPELDLASIGDAVSVSQIFRIYGLDESRDNRDYAAAGFRLLVTANRYADAPNTAGV